MRISTVIPAFNRADLIEETLHSIVSQTRPPMEVIVVDDGSTDGTRDKVAEFGGPVKLVCQANAGAGAARNAGLALARGDAIHFMDSDDLSSLNTYEVQAAILDQGIEMTYGPWLRTRFDGKTLNPDRAVLQQAPVRLGRPIDQLVLSGRWVTVLQPCLFHRALIERAGPYRTDLKPSEDTEMLYRLARSARGIRHTPETLLLYRVHPEHQISTMDSARRMIDKANLWSAFEQHLAQRSDVSLRTRLRVEQHLAQAAHDLASSDAATPHQFSRGGAFAWLTKAALDFSDRLSARWQLVTTGMREPADFRARPLSTGQREEIARLGYHLP